MIPNIQQEKEKQEQVRWVQGGIERRQGLDITALTEAKKILDGANVSPIEREVKGRVLTLASQAWEEIDEMALACLAAGVPSSRILIREPFPVVKGSVWQIEAGISFREDRKVELS
ncbi:hypothetical protein NVP1179O_22 [Vibrio phage 1.179.O._10N.286.45.F12]|nr:hypothetical protein NVP1179O_22 [Vibrio phage 1.179.O._10N.286.45.F12]